MITLPFTVHRFIYQPDVIEDQGAMCQVTKNNGRHFNMEIEMEVKGMKKKAGTLPKHI